MDERSILETELNLWAPEAGLPIAPVHVSVETFEDSLGQEGWEATLTLPRPQDGRWEPTRLFETRRSAAAKLDELAAQHGITRAASTLVTITGEGATSGPTAVDAEVAAEEQPEEGEEATRDATSPWHDWAEHKPDAGELL